MAVIAGVAIWNRDDPAVYTPTEARTAAEPDPVAPGPKIAERVGGAEPAPPADAGARAPPSVAGGPSAALGQRAVLYEESPDNPAVPRAVNGRAVWKIETVPGGQGQAAETAVRMDAEFPQAGMSVGVVLRRNGDAALPASHTMEVRFGFKAGGGPVRDMGLPQFKGEEGVRGAPVLGISVPVTEDYFLVGFSNLPADVERNLDILVNRNWIDIPLRLASGRRAIVTIEKGLAGTDAIQAAMARWRT